jgi:hypothetical protein
MARLAQGSQIPHRLIAALGLLDDMVDVGGADHQQSAQLADALVAGDDG